jgi:RNA polymerase sigma-70 factor (ECF subfamily)
MATPGQHSQAAQRRGKAGTELLRRLAGGDPAALQALYDSTVRTVFGLVQAIVLDPADAERITIEVYLDLWRNAAELDPDGDDIELCVLTAAHRHAVEHRRSLRPDAAVDSAVRQQATELSGVDTLDAVSGELLLLTYYGGYTCRQAAALLGLSVTTAQDRLRTALRAMARAGRRLSS